MTVELFDATELAPIVAKAIGQSQIDSIDWHVQPVGGIGGSQFTGTEGLLRLTGTARSARDIHSWSLIAKRFSLAAVDESLRDTADIPSAWNYWKREILAYESGILSSLDGALVAPHCYGVTERQDGELLLWLEDIEETSHDWPMARTSMAARHLGQFNGMYLFEDRLPQKQPWFYSGRVRDWRDFAIAQFDAFQRYAETANGQQWLNDASLQRMRRLLDCHPKIVAALNRLPKTFCHHDAYRRNLMAQDGPDGTSQTVAVDWSFAGYGSLGEDPGITTAVALTWLEVDADRARELDQTVFESFLDGLRDAGWHGDPRLARLGYVATASIATGVTSIILLATFFMATEEGSQAYEGMVGHPMAEILSQLAVVHPFLLNLGDEALQLMDELGH